MFFFFLLDLLGLVTSTWQNLRIQIQSMSVTVDIRTEESYSKTGNFGHDQPVSFSIAILTFSLVIIVEELVEKRAVFINYHTVCLQFVCLLW